MPAVVTRGSEAAQGDAEVGEQGTLGFVEQHVLGLDVAMHDAARMRIVERGQQRVQDRADTRMAGFLAVLGEVPLAQVAVREERHRVVRQSVGRAPDGEDADDVRMLEPGDGARFVLEAATADLVGKGFGQHHLDRDLALERRLLGQVYRGHAAMADHPRQPIAGDLRQFFARGQPVALRQRRVDVVFAQRSGHVGPGDAPEHTPTRLGR